MEENNVAYMTAEEIRTLDPSLISSMTMTSGETIYVNHDQSQQYVENICNDCAMNYQESQNYILRAKKETTVQEGEGGEKIEENVEIDIEAQPEGENNGQKVLRGPDGKLLIDMITGDDQLGVEGENQEQQIDENVNYQQQEEINEQYYDQQGMDQNQVSEEQYVQEQNEEMNYDGNEQQYYEQEYDSNVDQDPNYYPEEQYDPNSPSEEMNNQIVPEQNVGVDQEYTEQYEQEQGQEYMYPGEEENANQQYQQPEYQPPMNVQQENQQYNPEKEPEPPVETFDEQPPLQEPVQFPSPIQPTQQPNQPSTQKPIQTPVQKFPVAKDIKGFVPKKPGVQIKIGFGLPKQPKGKGFSKLNDPRLPIGLPKKGPMGRPGQGTMMPHGPKNIPKRGQNVGTRGKIIVVKPIGNLLNPHKIMTPISGLAVKRIGIKTTKPTTFNQGVARVTGGKPATVFRARQNAYNKQGYGYNTNYGVQTYGTGPNYNFHEIVETSDNSKSYVVVKKGGVTVSSDQ